jgi:hypothetical protein
MALDSLTSTLTITMQWTAAKNLVGVDYSPISNGSQVSKRSSVGTNANSNTNTGGNELVSFIQSIANSGSATFDLTNMTDILNQANTNLARVKGIEIRLLSTADDATNGTACTYITVGANGTNDWLSSNTGRGWLTSNTSSIDIPNGGALGLAFPNATGVPVNGTSKIIKVTNGDSGNTAAVQISLQGGTS